MIKRTSGVKSATALIYTGPGELTDIFVATDASNNVTLDIYDGIDDTGTKIIPQTVIPTSATVRSAHFQFEGKPFIDGLYIELTCSGTVGLSADFKA